MHLQKHPSIMFCTKGVLRSILKFSTAYVAAGGRRVSENTENQLKNFVVQLQ